MENTTSFKKGRKKQLRRRTSSSDSDDVEENEDLGNVLEEAKEVQKLRKRSHGVSVVSLAAGKKPEPVHKENNDDPFKLKTGGTVNMKALKKQKIIKKDPELDAVDLGNTFSAETNARDEDADMVKYIEEEMAKKKGLTKGSSDETENTSKISSDEVLYNVPEHLRSSTTKKSEEMLSNQMLSGIPEVDLGIEAKIKNIEATEEAKNKLVQERMNKKDSTMSFVPTNMAVNFVQHNRFNIETSETSQNRNREKRKEIPSASVAAARRDPQPVIKKFNSGVGKKQPCSKPDKATDDFYFEKFKKQFRR